jgi:hypothetical protein
MHGFALLCIALYCSAAMLSCTLGFALLTFAAAWCESTMRTMLAVAQVTECRFGCRNYNDPSAWADQYSTCGGYRQSPINIVNPVYQGHCDGITYVTRPGGCSKFEQFMTNSTFEVCHARLPWWCLMHCGSHAQVEFDKSCADTFSVKYKVRCSTPAYECIDFPARNTGKVIRAPSVSFPHPIGTHQRWRVSRRGDAPCALEQR